MSLREYLGTLPFRRKTRTSYVQTLFGFADRLGSETETGDLLSIVRHGS
jgi:hypothetical protein